MSSYKFKPTTTLFFYNRFFNILIDSLFGQSEVSVSQHTSATILLKQQTQIVTKIRRLSADDDASNIVLTHNVR